MLRFSSRIRHSDDYSLQLVELLCGIGTSRKDISEIQLVVSKAQRSTEGWRYAEACLRNEDRNVRFLGASTFAIKINKDWQELSILERKYHLILL